MIGLIVLLFLVALAIAAPLVGYDSRVVDADRRVRWWPAEPLAERAGADARGLDRGPRAQTRRTKRFALSS